MSAIRFHILTPCKSERVLREFHLMKILKFQRFNAKTRSPYYKIVYIAEKKLFYARDEKRGGKTV